MKSSSNINTIISSFSILLIIISIFAMISFFDLGGAIDVILKENMHSVFAGEEMFDNINKMHTLLLRNNNIAVTKKLIVLERYKAGFSESLLKAKNNITINGEDEIVKRISEQFDNYSSRLVLLKKNAITRESYQNLLNNLDSIYIDLCANIKNLLLLNHQAMTSADINAKKLAKNRSIWMVFFALIGFISAFYLNRYLKMKFTNPIYEILVLLKRISYGEIDIRLKKYEGMLGDLTDFINNLIDKIRLQQSQLNEYAFEQRDILASVIETFSEPAFIINVNNEIILSNRIAHNMLLNDNSNEFIRNLLHAVNEGEDEMIYNEAHYSIEIKDLENSNLKLTGHLLLLTKEG